MRSTRTVTALVVLLAALAGHAQASVPVAKAAGDPVLLPGEGPAYAVWRDDQGWHIRWTGGTDPAIKTTFTGVISVPGARIALIKPKMKGGDDSLNRMDQTRAFFKSETANAVEGMDFKVAKGAGSVYLELFIQYDVLAPKSVMIGKDRVHPDAVSPSIQIRLEAP